jgi:hypothetical protein
MSGRCLCWASDISSADRRHPTSNNHTSYYYTDDSKQQALLFLSQDDHHPIVQHYTNNTAQQPSIRIHTNHNAASQPIPTCARLPQERNLLVTVTHHHLDITTSQPGIATKP